MSLEMKAARAMAGTQQGISWGAITKGLGSAAGWLSGILGGGGPGKQAPRPQTYGGGRPGLDLGDVAPGVFTRRGAMPPRMMPPMQTASQNGMTISCPSGYRPNKSGYYVADGNGGGIYVAPGTKCVKKRRRNSLNPRAASRAMARIEGGKKAAEMFNRVTIRKKKC